MLTDQPLTHTALVGLGVMGQAFAENLLRRESCLVVFDTNAEVVTTFADANPGAIGVSTLADLVASLAAPRRVLVLVPAGPAVDAVIADLLKVLDPGDVIVDLGNSNWQDTQARAQHIEPSGILFVGSGISGGEEGARNGPAMMPGGNPKAWPLIQATLQGASAQVNGEACCHWIGRGGAGHFVKMVHNGIEYADMQAIAEAYDLMHRGLGLSHADMAEQFSQWNQGELSGYLVEIAADILRTSDADGTPLVEKVLDVAGQKGTGTWTGVNGLELGVPLGQITESVFARATSARKAERKRMAQRYASRLPQTGSIDDTALLAQLGDALLGARIVSYTQGFMLMSEASATHGFDLDLPAIARGWRGGCIIRSVLLEPIATALANVDTGANLLLDEAIADRVAACIPAWRQVVMAGTGAGVALPSLASGLNFFDSMRSGRLPANMLQALRDCFGAHTYERVDAPRGEFFHSSWTSKS